MLPPLDPKLAGWLLFNALWAIAVWKSVRR